MECVICGKTFNECHGHKCSKAALTKWKQSEAGKNSARKVNRRIGQGNTTGDNIDVGFAMVKYRY